MRVIRGVTFLRFPSFIYLRSLQTVSTVGSRIGNELKWGDPVKVLIATAHRLLSEGVACLLASSHDIEVVGLHKTVAELLAQTDTLQPDAIIMTGKFPDGGGSELIAQVKQTYGSTAILVVSPAAEEDFVWALDAGAAGYIGPECSAREFVDAVRRVVSGEAVVTGVDRRSMATTPVATESDHKVAAAMVTLTPREKEVLSLLSHGLSNRQIAKDLFLSEHTIRTHVQNLRSKLNVRSKFQAAVLAMQVAPSQLHSRNQFRL